ncbi:G5 domain-containing protein [Bifidobacterium longum]|uniref:aggregation-promoting factor C-terminal-like domain-containing protein n=1 Tax=Bifidobacterium longum TaxID=216816 RepID=UPI001896AE66|nr:G5 domain-containing protein [Bifidobacterium longum]MDB6877695.1 G5 domain-containing protein [Bifidobacterium longum]
MAMARRWTPQRFVTLRRIRVIACIAATSIALAGSFAFTARKSVALNINGQTTQVTTYAMTATRLLEEQGVDIKTHDIVTTSSGDQLANHAVVTVQSAYQTTINIDGTAVPFWTVATSADQLLGFFEENQNNAAKITVDIKNVYNQLTGGLVINQSGPVTVIADGKSSVAPNGKLPAASILDSKGIVLNKEDRVSVEKDSDETILRVRRVTHGEKTRTSVIPFSTQTIIDPNLAEGQADVRQQGVNGEKTQVYDVTYVDGVAESETLKSETVTSMAIDQIIAVGAAKSDTDKGSDKKSDSADNGKADSGSNNQHESSNNNAGNTGGNNSGNTGNSGNSGNTGNTGNSGNTGNTGGGTNNNSGSSGSDSGTTPTPSGRLWHATVAQAQAYAAGAAAQRGWTGNDWDCLVKLWTRESSWLWYAENASSGAYGIPQSLPADKMAAFGANYRDDAAVQIDWGLWYIAQAYGSPSKAWQHSEQVGWY